MRYLYLTPGFQCGAAVHLRDAPPLALDQVQDLLGGYLEEVWSSAPVAGEPRIVVLDNEEGLLLNLAPSVRFPQVYSIDGVLRGPVVIMGMDEHGEQADLTDAQLARIVVTAAVDDDDHPFPILRIRE